MSEQIDVGDMKVTLITAWQFLNWELWDDYLVARLAPDFVAKVEEHRGHYVMVKDSAFGWREIRCDDAIRGCSVTLWKVTDGLRATRDTRDVNPA